MKITENNKCTYCSDSVDYIEHFFCNCPVVRDFWVYIEKTILHKTSVKVTLSNTDILFGVENSPQIRGIYHYINLLTLMGKMCISIFKKTESSLPLQYIFEREMKIRKIDA
eukprot:TRINITY_DN3130_c0_g1_i5.p3 TRINITY_DN3130_c0_g1~~TRINITY_DN3130_c0_g1_i5.p3  ORF type:complete len:111 (-),score=7.71 TRINITY_DN3130_c0_g1_i5:202-534(-)